MCGRYQTVFVTKFIQNLFERRSRFATFMIECLAVFKDWLKNRQDGFLEILFHSFTSFELS